MIPGLDHIGGKRVTVRRTESGVTVRLLANSKELALDGDEWIELVGLVVAVQAHANFVDGVD